MEKVRQAEKGIDVKATKQKLKDYLTWWLDNIVSGRCSEKTLRTYSDIVRLHLAPDLGKHEVGKLTAQHITTLMRAKEKAGLSARTVAHIRGTLRTALNDAMRLDIVERNVALRTDPPKQEASSREPFTVEEAKVFLAATSSDTNAVLYRLAVTLGLRRGELLGLKWSDIDLEAGTLRVSRSLGRVGKELVVKEPKTDRSKRTLSLGASNVASLRKHKDEQAFARRKAGSRWQETDYVFVSSIGTAIDPDNLSKQYKALLVGAGLRHQRFHDLRHTAATLMLRDGLPVHEVSAVLGHAQNSTTLNVYSHVLPGANERAANTMERLLG
ncbi:MAG: site-specific integrase [Thermomicrobiales bacterium]|nr:site-specific integrase [Thermomicrobiales bacterium]